MQQETVSIILSALAIAVAIGAAIASFATSHRQNQLQEQFLALEARRERNRQLDATQARLRAQVGSTGTGAWELRVFNEGAAEARAISAKIDGQPILQHPLVPRGVSEVRHLGPGADAAYVLVFHQDVASKFLLELEWEDPSGQGRWSSELSIF